MNATAGLGEHGHVGVIDLEARRPHLAVQVARAEGRQHPVIAQRHHVAAERHRLLEARRDDLDLLRLQPLDDVVLGRLEADRGAMLVEHAHHQVDMDIELIDRREFDLPAFLDEPLGDLAGGHFLRAMVGVADQSATPGRMMLKSPPSKLPALTMS